MELRHLRYFVAVADALNFTAAARKLGIAQPPLSLQIRKLETELGVSLFDRSNRKIQLTAPGKAFLEDARKLLAEAERSVRNLQDSAAGRLGEIAIRHTPAALSERITRRLRKFIRKNRGVRVRVESIDYKDIPYFGLPNYDVCIHDALPHENTPGIPLEKSAIRIAISSKHRLAERSAIALPDLVGERVLLGMAGHRPAAERYLAAHVQNLDVPIDTLSCDPVERLWQASLGLGISVCTTADRFACDAVLKPLTGEEMEITTLLTENPNSSAAGLAALAEAMQD